MYFALWNKWLRFLDDNNIPYKVIGEMSKTRDDAGLLIYFDSVIFRYDKYIPFVTNRKGITVAELIEKVRKEIAESNISKNIF